MCNLRDLSTQSDQDLLPLYNESGHNQETNELILRRGPGVRQAIRRILFWAPLDAEDCEQEYWNSLQWKKRHFHLVDNLPEPVRRWMETIANRDAIGIVKKLRRKGRIFVAVEPQTLDGLESKESAVETPGHLPDQTVQLGIMRMAIAQLPEEDRALLNLVRPGSNASKPRMPSNQRKNQRLGVGLGTMGQEAVAELLGYSNAGSVNRRLDEIRSRLRELMDLSGESFDLSR